MSDILDFKFTFNKDNLKNIIDALKDLVKIDTMIKIKFDQEHVLFYAKAGKDNNIIAFKSFIFPIEDFIISDEYVTIDFIILNGGNFVKNLELFLSKDNAIQGKLQYKHKDKIASMFYITDGKLKINFITGDYRMIKDISKKEIEMKMDPDNAEFMFSLDKDQFNEIKKLSTLNKSETVSLKVKNKKLSFFDERWDNYISDVDVEDTVWSFNNKYLKSINPSNEINIHMFDTFLLFKEDNISLMIGLELSDIK